VVRIGILNFRAQARKRFGGSLTFPISNKIQLPLPLLRQPALQTHPANDQSVRVDAELVFPGDGFAKLQQLVALEFDQLVAFGAVQVVVLRVAIVVFIHGTAVERHLAEQARIDHFRERPIDGRAADVFAVLGQQQIGQQLIGVEMLVPRSDLLDDDLALLRNPLAAALQKFLKAGQRRKGRGDAGKGGFGGHQTNLKKIFDKSCSQASFYQAKMPRKNCRATAGGTGRLSTSVLFGEFAKHW